MKKIFTLILGALTAISFSSCAMPTEGADGDAGGQNMWMILILYAVIIGGLYFFLIRPNSKKKKQEEALRESVEIGDEITTIGGITGRVISVKEDTASIVIETSADRTKMHIKKWAISTIDNEKELPADTKKDKKTKDKPKEK